MTIISINKLKKYNDFKLTLDNGTFLIANIDIVTKFNLLKDAVITSDLVLEIEKLQTLIECKRKAFSYCTYSKRTVQQVKTKLLSLGFKNNEISKTIESLEDLGLLNDLDFANKFIQYNIKSKQSSKFYLIQKLLGKGIKKEIIDEALASTYPDSSELEFALALAKKKLAQLIIKPPERKRKNIIAYLKARGFSFDIIKKVINELGV